MQIGALSPGGSLSDPSRVHATRAAPEFAQALQRAEGQAVQAQRTRLSTAEASSALETAWGEHFGQTPKPETVAILTAQWSHETGGGSSMFNFNFGGIKGTGPSGLHVTQRTREGYGASEVTIRDRFRAYQNANEGATDYVGLLGRKYPKALEAAEQGDAARFVEELHAGGYFTGDKAAYTRSVTNKTASLLKSDGAEMKAPFSPTEALPMAPRTFAPGPARIPHGRSFVAEASPASSPIHLQSFTDHLAIAALRIAERPEREST